MSQSSFMGPNDVPLHHPNHENGGTDELNIAGLSGVAANEQPSSWSQVSGKPTEYPPEAHHAKHELGGSDPLDLTGLTGATTYTSIGQLAAVHFDEGDFTFDNAYHTLSLSAIIPEGTKLVHFSLELLRPLAGQFFYVINGDWTGGWNYFALCCQVTNIWVIGQGWMTVNAAREIKYKSDLTGSKQVRLSILGWLK